MKVQWKGLRIGAGRRTKGEGRKAKDERRRTKGEGRNLYISKKGKEKSEDKGANSNNAPSSFVDSKVELSNHFGFYFDSGSK
jgi:hypothetical protein